MADLEEYEAIVGNGDAKEEIKGKQEVTYQEKDRSADRERDRDKDRDRKDKRRSRSRERPRKERDNDYRTSSRRSRSRSKERRRDRASGRDRDREKDRERDRDRDRDRDRERYKGVDRGEFDRGGPRGRDRDRRPPPARRDITPPEVRAARERERELRELERATRTVFAFNLNIKADERDIYEFFSKAGQVTDIRLITDRHTKRSKGLAYVEFSKQEEVFLGLALTGQLMLGQPVMVKPAEAEKNLAWEAQQAAKAGTAAEAELADLGLAPTPLGMPAAAPPAGPLKLQVTGFKKGLTENEIKQIFEPFGPIDNVMVVRDGAGQPIDIAYVIFHSTLDGENAKAHWHGKVLLEHKLNVVVAPLKGAGVQQEQTANIGDLDDEDYRLNPQARAALMGRLAASAGIGPPSGGTANPLLAAGMPGLATGIIPGILPGGLIAPGVPGAMAAAAAAAVPGVMSAALPLAGAIPAAVDLSLQQGRLGPPSPIPTQCLLLKNMFDDTQKAEAGWAEEIADDVKEECSKLGQVQHLFLDRDSQGFVYIKFGNAEAAAAAHKMLHGRFYNGHQIQAAYQFVQTYNQHFGL